MIFEMSELWGTCSGKPAKEKELCCSEHSRKKVGDLKSALTSDMEMQFGDFQAGFWFCFGPLFPHDDI